MFIKRLKVSGLLSFGPTGIDLPMENLNVLIGPNGSGKSNFLEVLALLKAAPRDLSEPVKKMGGINEWLWKGDEITKEAVIQTTLELPEAVLPLRHSMSFGEHGERFEVIDERIENKSPDSDSTECQALYRFDGGDAFVNEGPSPPRTLDRSGLRPEESILSQLRDPERYPALGWLQNQYEQIRLFRDWAFGPGAQLRRAQSVQGSGDFLREDGENLSMALMNIRPKVKDDIVDALKKLYDGIKTIHMTVEAGNILLSIEKEGGRHISASRLSDGTLRYLCLLAILLHPEPPPLVAIEEPELGLHPDVIPEVADLLVQASERTQLVVTTHSRMLIDALSDDSTRVVVCEKEGGESRFERLDSQQLAAWLEKYSLGDLWSKGEIGGNRW
jgi:predicted ATPase